MGIRQFIGIAAGTGLTAVLSLLYAVYAANVLPTAVFGEVVTALSLILAIQTAFGPIHGTVTQFTAEYVTAGEPGRVHVLYGSSFRRVTIWGCLLAIPAMIFVVPLRDVLRFQSRWTLMLVVLIAFASVLNNVGRGVLRGAGRFGAYNANTVLESVVRLIVGVALLMVHPAAATALTAYLAAMLVAAWSSHLKIKAMPGVGAKERTDWIAWRRFTGGMFLLTVTSALAQNMDLVLVKHYFPAMEAGVFASAVTLTRSLTLLIAPFNLVLMPLLAVQHQHGRPTSRVLAGLIGGYVLVATTPILVTGIWSTELMSLLFRDEYGLAAMWLPGLMTARLAGHLSGMLAMAGAARSDFRIIRVFAPATILQFVALMVWHDSLATVVAVVVIIQTATLVVMAAVWIWISPRNCATS